MTYHHKLPVDTIVSCYYCSSQHPKDGYELIGIVKGEYKDRSVYKVLKGGWNHKVEDTYGMPEITDPDYSEFKIYTSENFPYPELLL